MIKSVAIFALVVTAGAANAQYYGQGRPQGYGSNPNSHYVQPHTRNDGSYVGGHYRTNPNQSQNDNYGASGNYNPYSGGYGGQRRSNQW